MRPRPRRDNLGKDQRVASPGTAAPQHQFIIIGAGMCGLYQLHKLLLAGADVTLLERADDVGGTWYRNRYPGCRFDSESYTYGYSFSKELLDEWDWSEHFAAQPETLRYVNHVVDKFKLRQHIQFGCSLERATFDDANNIWTLELAGGRTLTCRFLLTAIGLLSAPTLPRLAGMDSFLGPSFHTYYWPSEPLELAGKRVGIVGTGATGVQLIGEIADKVGDLIVFQRRPNWCAPLHNTPITASQMVSIRAAYDQIFEKCSATPGGFIHGPDRRRVADVPAEERLAFWEKLYASPGFGIWLGNFRDVLMDESANAQFSAFVADKIRQRVKDPAIAEQLIPKDHGFGVQRVPMETGYYEAYNRNNVHLANIEKTPIERVTPTGIRTTAQHHDLDLIVYATGFDAVTGAFDQIDFINATGQHLRDKWRDGPVNYLGMQSSGFPNLFMLAGPQSASLSTNFPRGIESAVDWATIFFQQIMERAITRVEPTVEAERQWTEHVKEMYQGLLLRKAKSWFTGYNSNVEGHDKIRYMIYNGGAPRYRQKLAEVAASGYEGFQLS
ncbi:flavin-containing monooxygenase [Piscinibacter sakaiensis]|uniref:flavin-containing monooxygenase n=1 Tax=Piscinibacter sakaiensis TaxID=1547922 RepID=UPI003AAE9F39